MRRVVIESPFSSGTLRPIPAVVERNVRYLRACMRDALLRGESPFASHGLYTQEGVLDDNTPEERTLGIEAGFEWRPVARATVFYVDLGWSTGMLFGKAHAQGLMAGTYSGGHVIEERALGGEWAQCLGCSHLGDNAGPGPGHCHACPLWRIK